VLERLDIALADAAAHHMAAMGAVAPKRTASGRRLSRAPSNGSQAGGPAAAQNQSPNPGGEAPRRGSLVAAPRASIGRRASVGPGSRRGSVTAAAAAAAAAATASAAGAAGDSAAEAAFFPDLLVLLKALRVRVRTLPRRPLASRTCRCCSRRAGSLQVRVLVDVGQCVPQPRAPCRV